MERLRKTADETFVQRTKDDRSSAPGLSGASLRCKESYDVNSLQEETLMAEPQSALPQVTRLLLIALANSTIRHGEMTNGTPTKPLFAN